MIERVQISNFRCLRSVDVELKPLTVLIGPNDSGKSSFLQALEYVCAAADEKIVASDYWRQDRANRILIRAQVSGHWHEAGSGDLSATRHRRVLLDDIPQPPTAQRFQLPVTGIAHTAEGYGIPIERLAIESDGANLAAVLDWLQRKDRRQFSAIEEKLQELVPGLEQINIETPKPSDRAIELVIENGLTISAEQASAGLRLLMFFVTLSFLPEPVGLVMIEEPENGIHPHRLGDVMRLIRGLSEGTFSGRSTQVLLTTHSPYLLDHISLDLDQVLVFKREDDGSRSVTPADHERLKVFTDEFKLGEVWFNEEEAGLVGQQ